MVIFLLEIALPYPLQTTLFCTRLYVPSGPLFQCKHLVVSKHLMNSDSGLLQKR